MKAIILAAGKGERLNPLTEKIPKAMIPINGKPLLEYILLLCKEHGIKDIAINTSYLSDKIKDYFGTGEKWGVNIKFSFESELLGTSGALNNFRDFFRNEPFFVIYGDNITDVNLSEMMDQYNKSKPFSSIFLYHEKMADEKTTFGCVVIDDKKNVKKIIENLDKSSIEYLKNISEKFKFTNSGIYILDNKALDFIPNGFSDFAKDIFPLLLEKDKKIVGYFENCYIREIGQMHRYEKAKKEIESGEIKLDYIENE